MRCTRRTSRPDRPNQGVQNSGRMANTLRQDVLRETHMNTPGADNPFLKSLKKEAERNAEEAQKLINATSDPKPAPSVTKLDEGQALAQAQPQGAPPKRNGQYRWGSGRRRLEVNAIPGYRLYWHKTSDIPDALAGGWEFVHKDEIQLNST